MKIMIEGNPDYYVTDDGKVFHGDVQLGSINGNGYYRVKLRRGTGRGWWKDILVHHLVAHHFIGPKPKGLETRHLDGNKLNNHVLNLIYGTHKQNMNDITKRPVGSQRKDAKLTEEMVVNIRLKWANGSTKAALAKEFDIGESTIQKIVSYERWKHVLAGDRFALEATRRKCGRVWNGRLARDKSVSV